MTIGQRIAQKRKELGLSQEGLGEQLGVSRQSIYKWESDAALPEVEKLITLSRIFGVSVGWLLGVEEDASPEQPDGQLTEAQLAMVREIVEQYLAALPKGEQTEPPTAEPRRRRRWPRVLAGCGILVLLVVLINLFGQLDQVTRDYQSLQYSLQNVQNTVNNQIGSITSRVEDILQSQNTLTAEYRTEHRSNDLAANTATFAVYAVPKTYLPGMTATFLARSGGETTQITVEPGENNAFSTQITCPLTDDITLSVVFRTGDKEETQWLEDYDYLYSDTFPNLSIQFGLFFEEEDGVLPAQTAQDGTTVYAFGSSTGEELSSQDMDLRVGLFRDQKLVMWYQQGTREVIINGTRANEQVWFRPQEVTLEPGHEYVEAILYTDSYGRQRIYPDAPLVYDEEQGSWGGPGAYSLDSDPAAWEF